MIKIAACLTITSGCYFYYPQLPKPSPVPIVDGAELEVKTRIKSDYYPCGANDKDCVIHDGKLRTKSDFTLVKATYDGKALTQGEFRSLADPEYPKKIDQIKAKKGTCNISLVPSAIAAVGIVGETVVLAASDQFGSKALPLALISGGVAVVFAALSYPLGGYACRDARKLFDSMNLTYADSTEFPLGSWGSGAHTEDAIVDEMKALAETFNARFRSKPTPPEPESPATE